MWLGWFGIHAGASLQTSSLSGPAILNTLLAPSAGLLAWTIAEALAKGRASALGALSGVLSGLVAITPAAGFVDAPAALVIGLAAGFAGLWGATGLKRFTGADDAIDVFGIHGVTPAVGVILTGVFASQAHVLTQLTGLLVTVLWSTVIALLAFKLVDVVLGVRVREAEEREGLDAAELGESAYSDRFRD